MYVRDEYNFGRVVEIEDHHTARYRPPGEKRGKREKPTPKEMEKYNQYMKVKKCRHKLRKYFTDKDYWVLLTWRREERPPDMAVAKKIFSDFMKKVRKLYKLKETPCRWIRNIEVGSRGAWHIHLIINRISDLDVILNEAWRWGRVSIRFLYEEGGFADLAEYVTKSEKTDSSLREANYSTSRNMPLDPPHRTVYLRWRTWKENLRVPKGYEVDKNSIVEGINPITGYPYRRYTAYKIPEKGKRKHEVQSI